MLELTREAGRPIDPSDVDALEKEMRVKFPEPYRAFLIAYHGGRPTPSNFFPVIHGRVTPMRIHFFLGIYDDLNSCDLRWNFNTLKGRIPNKVIPIASDEFGNRFCLDLRSRVTSPVLFWNHEEEAAGPKGAIKVAVATSFDDWLRQLTHQD
jgi:cell wall assembly regulator SMI1